MVFYIHAVLLFHSTEIFSNWFCVFSSLPEVPALVDVPSVSAQLDDSLLGLLRDRVSRHGSVSSHPPVQIEELQERPGSILVRWCKVSKWHELREHTHIHREHAEANVKHFLSCVCVRWMRTLQQQIIGCSIGGPAAGGASTRTPTSVGTVSSWSSTSTLTLIICSGSAPAGRVAPSGAPGASRRRVTPHSYRMVGEDSAAVSDPWRAAQKPV